MSASPAQLQFILQRPPRSDDELYELLETLWGINIPRTKVCMEHTPPFEAFADAFFARSPVSIWKASRGFGGKSMTLALLTITEAVVLGAEANILGGSGAQSQNVHEHMREAWDWKLAPEHMIRRENNFETALDNGAKVRALMASQRSVRGPHPQRLRLDEIDEMDVDILDAALGQPMPKGGVETQTVMSSTHQYPDKTMTEMLLRATQKNWPVYEWCFRETSNPEDGWLAPTTVDRKRQEVTKHMWEVEYDLQEPTIGSRAFDTEMVEKMFSLGDDVFKTSGPLKGEQYTFEEPRRDADYVTGADWAKERDYTVIATFKTSVEPWELVAYSRTNRRPYPLMVKLMNDRVEAYGGGAIHDGTGLGNVVNDYLDHRVKSFIMAGRQRDDMLSEYVAAVEKEQLRAPKVESAFGEHKYCSIEDMYGRGTNAHLPDTVCAFALCWHLRKRGPTRVKPVIDVTHEDGSPWRALEVNKKDSNPGAWTL